MSVSEPRAKIDSTFLHDGSTQGQFGTRFPPPLSSAVSLFHLLGKKINPP